MPFDLSIRYIQKMIFISGFPGFLASELLTRLFNKNRGTQIICLVQSKFKPLAEENRKALADKFSIPLTQIQLIEGDISVAGLGLNAPLPFDQIKEIFHLAAVYDLSVSKSLGEKVNQEGTRNMLAFAKTCTQLTCFQYVSTCYVSGKFPGTFLETDLEKHQTFNNFYESTKYEAELLVREAMKKGLPATIYRPSIVVGNSDTGETQKFDGPYFVIQWLLRQGKHAILPKLSNPAHYTINFVPSNFVLDAIGYLHDRPESIGKTFQLADPAPLTIAEVVQVLAEACERKLISIPLPKSLAKFAVRYVPGVQRFLGIPYSTLDYFVHPTNYDVSDTLKALQGSGIACPPFRSYAKTLVGFMRKNPQIRNHALT